MVIILKMRCNAAQLPLRQDRSALVWISR